MTRALVLMKAMPPTKGHERLIEFARMFASEGVVLIDTAPNEPLAHERVSWIERQLILTDWRVAWQELDDQDSKSDGFWERWKTHIAQEGEFDLVIGSEPYCAKVAEVIGARYVPYDPYRQLEPARGTTVRNNLMEYFCEVSESFQPELRTTVTIFGAESTGKTTLSQALASRLNAEWVFEWARPYLEATGKNVVDLEAMHDIWSGQCAAEWNAEKFAVDKPFIIRDTDLYSTIGYWEQPEWLDKLGPVPEGLIFDAKLNKADLYIITSSNIPFEKDPLRYGGDHRESTDEYWIEVAEKYDLNYVVLTESDRFDRLPRAEWLSEEAFFKKNKNLTDAVRV